MYILTYKNVARSGPKWRSCHMESYEIQGFRGQKKKSWKLDFIFQNWKVMEFCKKMIEVVMEFFKHCVISTSGNILGSMSWEIWFPYWSFSMSGSPIILPDLNVVPLVPTVDIVKQYWWKWIIHCRKGVIQLPNTKCKITSRMVCNMPVLKEERTNHK